MEPVIVVHGGAGDVDDCRIEATMNGIKLAALEGYRALQCTGSVVDAVETAINILEDDKNFNAGTGSVLNIEGNVEMESSIMLGKKLNAGSVCVCRDIAHPVSLARMVMEKARHVMLGDCGAKKFAEHNNVPTVSPESLITDASKKDLQLFKKNSKSFEDMGKRGTVGAVAMDSDGSICAATSTGGLTGKMPGRVADSSSIGAGTYADDNSGGVSCTGYGENILKMALAHKICRDMEKKKTAKEALQRNISMLTAKLNTTAGAIAISKTGEVGVNFNTNRMPWAYVQGKNIHFGIEPGEHEIECIKEE